MLEVALENKSREMLEEILESVLEAMIVLDSAELEILESALMYEISVDTALILT